MRRAEILTAAALQVALAFVPFSPAHAGEADILRRIHQFFSTDEAPRRAELAAAIARDPAFARARISGWLHQANLHATESPGVTAMTVDVGLGQERAVAVRVPHGYDPRRAWPLLYLLHPSGSTGPRFLPYAEQTLGSRVEDWIVVAPTHYRQTGLDAPPPFTADHSAILRAARTRFNVDADRQIAMGFSLGGYAAWNLALLHAEETAGAVALGSCITVPPTEDGLWREVLPNLAHVKVLNVWGALDPLVVYDALGAREGTVPELNRRFIEWSAGMALPIRHIELPGIGHTVVPLVWQDLEPVFTHRRPHYPAVVDHTFRHIHQGRAYWLEAHAWEGEAWGAEPLRGARVEGESVDAAFGRAARARLGKLRGEIRGQEIHVSTQHVRELTVWVADQGRDWKQPITLWREGRQVFAATLEPDLLLALTQAVRTRDFENLRWAGLRVGSGTTETVTPGMKFPPLNP